MQTPAPKRTGFIPFFLSLSYRVMIPPGTSSRQPSLRALHPHFQALAKLILANASAMPQSMHVKAARALTASVTHATVRALHLVPIESSEMSRLLFILLLCASLIGPLAMQAGQSPGTSVSSD